MLSYLARVPWYAWGIACLVIAVIYVFYVPLPSPTYDLRNQVRWKFVVIRWFHPLVWVLLAAACLVMQSGADYAKPLARGLAFSGLAAYLVFIVTLLIEKQSAG